MSLVKSTQNKSSATFCNDTSCSEAKLERSWNALLWIRPALPGTAHLIQNVPWEASILKPLDGLRGVITLALQIMLAHVRLARSGGLGGLVCVHHRRQVLLLLLRLVVTRTTAIATTVAIRGLHNNQHRFTDIVVEQACLLVITAQQRQERRAANNRACARAIKYRPVNKCLHLLAVVPVAPARAADRL